LHKHPGRAQSVELPVGTAHVFYPEATRERCTAALLLEVDPIGLVRGKRFAGDGFSLSQYVNDLPYAASSMLAVALGTVFRTAMAGRCAARPDLAGTALPLVIRIPALPSRGGPDLVHRFFAPLGWTVRADPIPLDPQIPEWGDSRYVDATFTATMALDRALQLAERRLQLERMPDSQRSRLTLLQSSLTYRDDRLAGFDAAVLMEVIEHLDLDRLPSLERSVYGHARPRTVL
jgi:3' terminal RNA ribose 2'-O-methyltransferase Hen1